MKHFLSYAISILVSKMNIFRHWVDATTGGGLTQKGNTSPVVNTLVLTRIIIYIRDVNEYSTNRSPVRMLFLS